MLMKFILLTAFFIHFSTSQYPFTQAVKGDIRGYNDFVVFGVPAAVGLGTSFIPNKNHGQGLCIEFLAIMVVYPDTTTERM